MATCCAWATRLKSGTGARHSRYSQAQRPFKELKEGEEEVGICIADLQKQCCGCLLARAYNPAQESGRWQYEEKLGEGGLAVVYRARDVSGSLGEVAVKVSKFKNLPLVSNQNRHVYALHREAQWSMKCLHNTEDPRYDEKGAGLFAKYLEDHTGFDAHDDVSFDATRRKFEDPEFALASQMLSFFEGWSEFQPLEVVMELVEAKLLQSAIDANPPLDFAEKRTITRQCVDSLLYLSKFDALHRDFRGCNIFLQGRGKGCQLKVIDLGFMISADAHQEKNPNIAVRCAWQGNKARLACFEDQRIRFDWAPPEVRTKEDLVNSRDMSEKLVSITADIKELRLPPQLFRRMLDKNSENRPTPKDLSEAFVERPKRRKAERVTPLVQVQDKNLLIPVTPPSDGGMGVGYARGGTPGMIARAEN
ncbi:DTX45, partial [Symbiodinium sp. KB8]